MPDTIGRRLKEARLARHISLQDTSEATRIRLRYLEALEADDYSIMPSAAQARGFLRNYASFLGLDLDQILGEIQSVQPTQPSDDVRGPLEHADSVSAPPQIAVPAPPEEKPRTPPFWTSWLARLQKPDSTPEPIPAEETMPAQEPESVPVASAQNITSATKKVPQPIKESPKRRGPKKKTASAPASSKSLTRPAKKRSKKKDKPSGAALKAAKTHAPVVEQNQAEAEQARVEAEQLPAGPEAVNESKPGLLSRLQSLFALRINNKNVQEVQAETPEGQEPEPALEESAKPEPKMASRRPEESADEIFLEIGAQLRERREMLSLTMEEIERHTHVRAAFVKSLEEGAFDELPSAVQTRGMLANYASFLDLDTDAILLRFADALQARHRARFADEPRPPKNEMKLGQKLPPLRTFIAGDMLFGIGMIVMLIALGIWGLDRAFTSEAAKVVLPTAPSITDMLMTPQATVFQEVTLIPAENTPLATLEATAAPDAGTTLPTQDVNANVQVEISAVSSTFMRVLVDGKEMFNGRVLPGSEHPFDAANSVQVLTGNAAALRVTYNGRDLGLLGSFGEVVNYIYSANAITTPTPIASPTSTATPNVPATITQTFTPTATGTPTSTPVSSP